MMSLGKLRCSNVTLKGPQEGSKKARERGQEKPRPGGEKKEQSKGPPRKRWRQRKRDREKSKRKRRPILDSSEPADPRAAGKQTAGTKAQSEAVTEKKRQ